MARGSSRRAMRAPRADHPLRARCHGL